MDEPYDMPPTKGDNRSAPMSVIAACIERFRNQAPTPSNARSQIPAGKFWWLDANPSKEEVEPGPRPIANLIVDRGTVDRYGSTSPSYESDDESTYDGDIHFQKMVPKTLIRSNVEIYSPLEAITSTELLFSNDSTHQDLKAAFNLDSYAEKLLMKCDLLLKGYEKPKEQRLSDEPIERRRFRIKSRDNNVKSDNAEDSRVSFLVGKRHGPVTFSQETLSEEDLISLNGIEYPTEVHRDASNMTHTQLAFNRHSQSLNLSDSIDSLPMSPLGLSLALSSDCWGGLQMQGISVPASSEIDTRYLPATEMAPFISEGDATVDVAHRGVERTDADGASTGTGASPAAIASTFENAESAGGRGQPIRKAGLGIIDECSDDVSISFNTGFEPNLSESVSFPHFSAERPVPSKSRADSLLYVSSSSEGDFVSRAKGMHAGRHGGGISGEKSGDSKSDMRGREGALDAAADKPQVQAADRGVIEHAADDDDDGAHSSESCSGDVSDAKDSCDDDGAEESIQDPPGSNCVLSEVIEASATSLQSASSAFTFKGTALQSPLGADPGPCPLAESDVAPFLKDEITAMLWARLCKIREQMAAAGAASYDRCA